MASPHWKWSLDCTHEEGNKHHKYAVVVYCNDLMNNSWTYMPPHFSKLVCKFLQLPNTTVCWSVTGKRLNRRTGYGLEISEIYVLRGPKRTINWVKKAVVRELIRNIDT